MKTENTTPEDVTPGPRRPCPPSALALAGVLSTQPVSPTAGGRGNA